MTLETNLKFINNVEYTAIHIYSLYYLIKKTNPHYLTDSKERIRLIIRELEAAQIKNYGWFVSPQSRMNDKYPNGHFLGTDYNSDEEYWPDLLLLEDKSDWLMLKLRLGI